MSETEKKKTKNKTKQNKKINEAELKQAVKVNCKLEL